jgi:CRP/FNR family transcriptional regulator
MTPIMSVRAVPAESSPFAEAADLVPFLRALPSRDLERLRPYAKCHRLARGQRVWRQGDATSEFAFVARGRVKLVKAGESGRETILKLCGPGELLCANAVCSFAPYCCSATAMERAAVVVVPRRDVLEVLERSPAAAHAFLREVTARGISLCQRVDELSRGRVERRIATLLLRLAEQLGAPEGDKGTLIPIQLSRQDLADLCGTTIETAIRVMTRLARQSIVRSTARGLEIGDRPGLEEIARGVHDA